MTVGIYKIWPRIDMVTSVGRYIPSFTLSNDAKKNERVLNRRKETDEKFIFPGPLYLRTRYVPDT